MTDIPTLLVHFNRPDLTKRQIESLERVAPRRLWILGDGPRPGKNEDQKIREVRALLDRLPWDCSVRRLYRDGNLGCYRNISQGISWFLGEAGAGIILEDDCLPDPTFFPFCEQLLARYSDQDNVFAISGHTHSRNALPIPQDYAFSNYFSSWGWATWQRAWRRFDPDLVGWSDAAQWQEITRRVMPKTRARLYWRWMFGQVAQGRRDSWFYRFLLSLWREQGLAVVPRVNLVENIGFAEGATHTAHMGGLEVVARPMSFPMTHPQALAADLRVDQRFEDRVHSKDFVHRCQWALRRLGVRRAIPDRET